MFNPYKLFKVKRLGNCHDCKQRVNIGDIGYWNPNRRQLYCDPCGYKRFAQVESGNFDAQVYENNLSEYFRQGL